jgi:hypothetical protein
MLFLEFTSGELLVSFCRSALQARIAAESRSYSKTFCNDRVKEALFQFMYHVIAQDQMKISF